MVDPQNQHQQQQEEQRNRIRLGNGINEYIRLTRELNQRNEIRERRNHRSAAINNTAGYRTGNRVHHLRVIQMYNPVDWNALFGRENLDPILREYAQASIDYAQDHTLPFAGQMEVSLLMQENYRPGVHVASFFIHLTPHRAFHDGHMIQMEFGNGSNTHLTINRLFDTNTRPVVLQATQYQLLEFLADDDEAMDLLHGSFLDDDFNPTRYSYNNGRADRDGDGDGDGYYIANPYAIDEHEWHECAEQPPVAADAADAADIPVPPPVNDFAEIYQQNYNMYHANDGEDEDEDEDEDIIIRNNNIIHYIYNYNDVDTNFPAQG